MRTKVIVSFLLFGILIQIIIGCKKEKEPDQSNNPEAAAFKGIAASETNNNIYPYAAIDKSGNRVIVKTNSSKTKVEAAVFIDEDGNEFSVFMDNNGKVKYAFMSNFILVYDNYTSSTVDVAVIKPGGTIKIFRKVVFDASLFKSDKSTTSFSLREGLRYASIALSVAGCVAGYIAAPAGIGVPVAIACTAALINILSELIQSDIDAINASAGAFGYFAGIIGCGSGDPFDCAGLVADLGGDALDASASNINNQEEDVYLASSALHYQGGDIQITLTWDNSSDLDLWVTDPNNEKIYWKHQSSSSGGQLDVDDINGYGPENIFWDQNLAIDGNYIIEVDYYSGTGTANYTVLVQVKDAINKYNGTIYPDQTKQVASFMYQQKKFTFKEINKPFEDENIKEKKQLPSSSN